MQLQWSKNIEDMGPNLLKLGWSHFRFLDYAKVDWQVPIHPSWHLYALVILGWVRVVSCGSLLAHLRQYDYIASPSRHPEITITTGSNLGNLRSKRPFFQVWIWTFELILHISLNPEIKPPGLLWVYYFAKNLKILHWGPWKSPSRYRFGAIDRVRVMVTPLGLYYVLLMHGMNDLIGSTEENNPPLLDFVTWYK